MRLTRWIPAAASLVALAPAALADNHNWVIAEIFSSADGTVQFIEMSNPDEDEHVLSETSISTASGSFFAFPSNLPSSATENRRVLLATAAFAAIPGAPAPDYVIPAGFLRRTGDTVTYAGTPHAVAFGALPDDGLRSINAAGTMATNSPTNFAGVTGSVNLATSVVRNGSGVNPLVYTATPPALGKLWVATVDTSGHPAATGVNLTGLALPFTGPNRRIGQLLVDISSRLYFNRTNPVVGGKATFQAQMPVNIALIGRTIASQGLLISTSPKLTNAVDMKIGW